MEVSKDTIEELKKQLAGEDNAGEQLEIIAKILWVLKNFPQFNYGYVDGYDPLHPYDNFQLPSDEVIELTDQQELDFMACGIHPMDNSGGRG